MMVSIDNNCHVNSPSKGNQTKYKKDNKWYKIDHLGYEAAAEVATAEILSQSDIVYPFVKYELENIEISTRTGKKKVHGCSSNNFLNPGESIITIQDIFEKVEGKTPTEALRNKTVEEKIKYTVDTVERVTGLKDFGKYLTTILELDAFIYNEDRHFNNIAVIEDSNGNFRSCPIFDNGAAFLSDLNEYSGERIGLLRKAVLSKPFSENFNEQVVICRKLYGHQLNFYKSLDLSQETKDSIKKMYGERILDRIENTIRFSKVICPEMMSCMSSIENSKNSLELKKELERN